MEILSYTEKHQKFRERFRGFLEKEICPYIAQWDKDKLVPKSVWQKMGGEGFLCTSISPEYGGRGGDFLYSVIVLEEIARINYMALFVYLHSDVVVPYIDAYASDELKRKYLPGCVTGDIITAVAMSEPDAGSDLASMTTTAVEEGEDVVINGSKTFISNGVNCDLVVLAARDPYADNPHQAISMYLVEADTPGFKKGTQFEKMGMHSQDTTELFFTNCRIPKTNRLGKKGAGFKMLMEKLQQERLVCAVGAISSARFVLDWTLDYCKKTIVNGKPICKSQAVQFALAEMATEAELGKAFVDKLVANHMEGKNVVAETSMAKYWTTEMAKRAADRCMDLLEDSGGMDKCPVVRAYKDVRVMSIFAGTNEIMKGIVAKSMGL